MKLELLPLFSTSKEILVFAGALLAVFFFSLGMEYRQFHMLTGFDDSVVSATVLQQSVRQKNSHTYQMFKLRSEAGALIYLSGSRALRNLEGYRVMVRIRTDTLTFMEYMRGFYAKGYIESVLPGRRANYCLADTIASQHTDPRLGRLMAAMVTAVPLPRAAREQLSQLGISHLLAISGFHIGLLSAILYGLLRYPYRCFQSRWFPWRNGRRDLLIASALLLGGYVVFLQMTPSVLRAYAMMLVGFILYDRGIRLLSFHALTVAVLLLCALWPRLLFSVGFWLSVGGVFYIFAFLQQFGSRGPVFKFVGIHVWMYLMMLPVALGLFGVFSLLHPLSVLWTMLFILFYPVALLLHLLGEGSILDDILSGVFSMQTDAVTFERESLMLFVWAGLSLLLPVSETVKRLLPYLAAAVFIGAVYQVT